MCQSWEPDCSNPIQPRSLLAEDSSITQVAGWYWLELGALNTLLATAYYFVENGLDQKFDWGTKSNFAVSLAVWTTWLTWGVIFIVGLFANLFGVFVDFYAIWGTVTSLVGYFVVPFVSVWWLLGAF